MKFVATTVMGLLMAVSSVHAESKTTVEGIFAVCSCGASDNGVANRVSKVTGDKAASHRAAAIYLAQKACEKRFVNEDISFDPGSCVFTQAVSQTFKKNNKEKTKYRIEKLTGDDEVNLQADLMSTLNN